MAMRGAIAYSAFRRSKTHLVYTTEDLRVRFVDRTHFFGRAHPEKRAYALPIGKVGLGVKRAVGTAKLMAPWNFAPLRTAVAIAVIPNVNSSRE